MIYEYECPIHGRFDTTSRADNHPCPHDETCLQLSRRVWSVNRAKGIGEHFNFSLGQHVSSSRDFDEKLKIAGEAAGTTYGRVEPGEVTRPTSDDGIFDTQMKTLTDKGFRGSDGKVSIDDSGHFVKKV